jgi:phage shock protein C
MKRLYRSKDKMISGVCAGIAEYFSIAPTMVRLGVVVAGVLSIIGWIPLLVAYFIAAIIVPEEDINNDITN